MTLTRLGTLSLIIGALAGTSGCALFERGYERLYQALDTREQLTRQPPPTASGNGPAMSYSEYQTERHRLLDEKPAK